MKYKAIIFDVGDTLVEYSPNYEQIYGDRLRNLGINFCDRVSKSIANAIYMASGEQIQREQNGATRITDDEFESLLNRAALLCIKEESNEFDILLEKMNQMPRPKQEMIVIQGVFDLLDRLKEHGFILAIVSNHSASLMDFLKKVGLHAYFKTIIISGIVGVEKPNVQIMELVLGELDLKASSCLYVGDHPLDVLCSKNAGMDCAWISPIDAKLPSTIPFVEDYHIEKVMDILDVLK